MVPIRAGALACITCVAFASVFGLQQDTSPHDQAADPAPEALEEAWASFGNAIPQAQAEIVKEIAALIEATDDQSLRSLLALRDRAARELGPQIEPARPDEYYDPKVYADREFARGRVRRAPVDPSSLDAAEKRGTFRPWENAPPLAARVTWDFARDKAEDAGVDPEPIAQLESFLNGYVPGSDVLLAWLEKRFDFDAKSNPVADHFDHVYCDLNGKAYPEIRIYDAWSSGNGLDMPDVDVIAYARRILKDDSYHSPIPPDSRRAKLYQKVSDGFLEWFRYRLWIEAAANLLMRPTAPLRETHEGLRNRLLLLFALEEGDVDRIAKELASFKERDAFVAAMDAKLAADKKLAGKRKQFEEQRAAQHWAVARAAYAVLREHGMLPR